MLRTTRILTITAAGTDQDVKRGQRAFPPSSPAEESIGDAITAIQVISSLIGTLEIMMATATIQGQCALIPVGRVGTSHQDTTTESQIIQMRMIRIKDIAVLVVLRGHRALSPGRRIVQNRSRFFHVTTSTGRRGIETSFWEGELTTEASKYFRTASQDSISGQYFRTAFQDNISGQYFRTIFQDSISGQYGIYRFCIQFV